MYFVALLLKVRRIEEARTPEHTEVRDIHHVLADCGRVSHQEWSPSLAVHAAADDGQRSDRIRPDAHRARAQVSRHAPSAL